MSEGDNDGVDDQEQLIRQEFSRSAVIRFSFSRAAAIVRSRSISSCRSQIQFSSTAVIRFTSSRAAAVVRSSSISSCRRRSSSLTPPSSDTPPLFVPSLDLVQSLRVLGVAHI
ncbi:hypothetical protein LWI29_037121 [Acer saccharum]|uniref:Uncharacterized protein n=1 Tax=Acer saccharum TaxID=4024 RepID=A0AA39TFD4_ACESA|nr:hypothetical protein LWI29_037121 [Acer saccharum]